MSNQSATIGIWSCWLAVALASSAGSQQRTVDPRQPIVAARRLPEQSVVPRVTGLSLDSARRILASANLRAILDTRAPTPGSANVQRQNPAGGAPIPADKTVVLTVSPVEFDDVGAVGPRPDVIRKVVVPDVVGKSTAVARMILARAQLRIAPRDAAVRGTTPGIVFRQNPSPGDSAPVGFSVAVLVASSIPLVVVPSLTNMPVTRAAMILERAGLTLGRVKDTPSSRTPQTVLSQRPQAGDSVEPRTPIALEIAAARPRTVPDVIGQTVGRATQVLADSNLTIVQDSTPSPDGPYRTVMQQMPRGGDPVPTNGVVRVRTLYPQVKVMPNVLGLTLESARARLSVEGIRLGEIASRVSNDSIDRVVTQIPGVGRTVSTGTVARLTIGTAQPVVAAVDSQPRRDSTPGVATTTPPPRDSTPSAVVSPPAPVPDSVKVPDVRGRRLAEARSALERIGLRVGVRSTAFDTAKVATETPVNVRVPLNALVRLTVASVIATTPTTTTTPSQPPQAARSTSPPPTNRPTTPREQPIPPQPFPLWWLGLGAFAAIGLAGFLWRLLRNPPRPQPRPEPEPGRPSDGSRPLTVAPQIGVALGRGAAWDSVLSAQQPLIGRSMELVPQTATTVADVIGTPPSVTILSMEPQ